MNTKQILMLAGGAIAGYLIYDKFIKKNGGTTESFANIEGTETDVPCSAVESQLLAQTYGADNPCGKFCDESGGVWHGYETALDGNVGHCTYSGMSVFPSKPVKKETIARNVSRPNPFDAFMKNRTR
jgi:hypothetical protein